MRCLLILSTASQCVCAKDQTGRVKRNYAFEYAQNVRIQIILRTRKVLIVLGFNDTSTLEGHFVSSPREREKRDRRESRGDEREGQGRKRNRNESEETEEIKTFPLYPYPLQG